MSLRDAAAAPAAPALVGVQLPPAAQSVLLRGVRCGAVQSVCARRGERVLLPELLVRGPEREC